VVDSEWWMVNGGWWMVNGGWWMVGTMNPVQLSFNIA
jgi:hypothetical protein